MRKRAATLTLHELSVRDLDIYWDYLTEASDKDLENPGVQNKCNQGKYQGFTWRDLGWLTLLRRACKLYNYTCTCGHTGKSGDAVNCHVIKYKCKLVGGRFQKKPKTKPKTTE